MIDLSKIKPGDSVTIHGTVREVFPHHLVVSLTDEDGNFQRGFCSREVASHTPKALSVGDRVKLKTGGMGFIRAIMGERAWVDLVDDPSEMMNGCAYGLSFMERA